MLSAQTKSGKVQDSILSVLKTESLIREAIPRKNLFRFFFFFNLALTPPPFFELLRGTFLKPDFIRCKVPQIVWTLVIPPNLP